ncbi:MAG: hypothetical protein MZV70_39055 [Desulfobacterales bacterium]|nr:hypothetical protein [Desulfobacterales bacterium]
MNVANKLRSNKNEPMVVSTRHSLMIAEMVGVGATVKEAFMDSLQMNPDILESVLLSLHLELGLTDRDAKGRYQLY